MTTSIYLFLFSLLRLAIQEPINCEENKLHSVYYATRCCRLTFPEKDHEFTKCHEDFFKMANRSVSKLTSPERIAINICAHECSLKKKGFFRAKYKGEFDTDAIEDYFLENYSKNIVFSTYMTDTFLKCLKFDSLGDVNIKYPNVTFLPMECDPQAARIMMCVRTKAMQGCPPSAWEYTSLECGVAKLYFKECVGSIEKVVRLVD